MTNKKIWQNRLQEGISDLDTLLKLVNVDPTQLIGMKNAAHDFSVKVPLRWIKKIKKSDPQDPLLLQILPQAKELIPRAGYSADALKERAISPTPGLLHKYQSRVLFITSGSCAINCRYCFRRHFPYDEHQKGQAQWRAAIEYITQHPEINEVIFSGGEPLILPDKMLGHLSKQLSNINHIKTLRIHTRLPVFIPERLDQDFIRWFVNDRFKSVLVVHINHPNEIDKDFAEKMQQLKRKGVTLLNQSVLLKGVNDDACILKQLSNRLFFECGIQPYYLNLLDKVTGTAHFRVPQKRARALYQELLALLPGYLVPKLVVEIPGKPSKVPII